MELGELCRLCCWLLYGYLHLLRTGLVGPRDPCLTGAPNVWSDYWHFWQLLISFGVFQASKRRYSIGFVSCGRRSHDRAVRATVRKGTVSNRSSWLVLGGCELLKHICSWCLLYCFVWKVLYNLPFSVGSDIQLTEPCLCSCVHFDYTFQWPNDQLWSLTSDAQLVTQGDWFLRYSQHLKLQLPKLLGPPALKMRCNLIQAPFPKLLSIFKMLRLCTYLFLAVSPQMYK